MPRFKVIRSVGGTHSQRLSAPSTLDFTCPAGGATVSTNSCGSTTPATLLTGWLERRLSQPSTWTACTHPFTLHVWRVILPPLSNLCELFWKPSQGSLHFAQIPSCRWTSLIFNVVAMYQNFTYETCKHVTFQVCNTAYFLISEMIIILWKLNDN